ncbi:Ig-like domain-containing protein [Delftia acidovorans]|uniref:Ig-like domain-containing protein n=1 Tax=Delftia acidovorans TaxID=80866 RepID=UPI003340B143
MRFGISSIRNTAILVMFSWITSGHAATFSTFIDDQPGFLSAIGSGTIATNENFSSSVNLKPIGSAGDPDVWNGFTVEAYGPNTGTTWSPSKYCQALNSGSGTSNFSEECLFWNPEAPAVPGIYAAVNLDNGISFKLANSAIAAFSFDFVDWNDGFERSNLQIFASDGTSKIVSDATNVLDAPPQKFGVTLSPSDIAAGLYIKEIRWIGIDTLGEVVGFYNFQTYTNPRIQNNLPIANPDKYSIPNSPTILNILANDTDADSDTLQIISINGNPVTRGTPTNILITDGSIEVSAVGVITFAPSVNATDPISFQYEISDGRGGTATGNVTLTNAIPPKPTITAVPTIGEFGLISLSSIIAFLSLFLRRKVV